MVISPMDALALRTKLSCCMVSIYKPQSAKTAQKHLTVCFIYFMNLTLCFYKSTYNEDNPANLKKWPSLIDNEF